MSFWSIFTSKFWDDLEELFYRMQRAEHRIAVLQADVERINADRKNINECFKDVDTDLQAINTKLAHLYDSSESHSKSIAQLKARRARPKKESEQK